MTLAQGANWSIEGVEDVDEVEEEDDEVDEVDEVDVVSEDVASVVVVVPVVLLGGGGGGPCLGPGGGGLGFEEGELVGCAEGVIAGDLLDPQAVGSIGDVPRRPRQCTTVSTLFGEWRNHFAAEVRKPALVATVVVVAVVAVAMNSSKKQTKRGMIVHMN